MSKKRSAHALALAAICLAASAPLAGAQAPPRPQPYLVRDVTLSRDAEVGAKVDVILRDGAIEAVRPAGSETPPGVRIVEGEGLICLPAFIDAYTRSGCETPEPVKDQDHPVDEKTDVRVDMRLANRKGIQPAFRAAEALAFEDGQSDGWQEAGFGIALVAPGGELLAGSSVLSVMREAAERDLVVDADVFAHAAFAASGDGYPSTLMAYMAQLRQFFMDAQRHALLVERSAAGRPGLRPPFDAELQRGAELLAGQTSLVCEAKSSRDMERWMKLSDQFGFSIAISGGLEAWRIADQLAAREIPVMLTLDWGDEVDDPLEKKKKEEKKEEEEAEEAADPEAEWEEAVAEEEQEPGAAAEATEEETEEEVVWEYEEPLGVRLERRREWEEGRDCALRLQEAGVAFAFGSDQAKPEKLLGKVRDLVEVGLDEEVALHALTVAAAQVLGQGERLGRVAPGYDATFTLWQGDPLTDEKAQVVWSFVDGFPSEFELEEEEEELEGDGPAEGVDVTGSWELEFDSEGEGLEEALLTLEMEEDGSFTGEFVFDSPMDGSEQSADVQGSVSGRELRGRCAFSIGEFEIKIKLEADIEGDALEGTSSFDTPFSEEPQATDFEGKRVPQRSTLEKRG